MPRPSLEHVRSQLLRAGFPPRHVNRYVRELQEHLADLVTREQSIGLTMQEAQAKARTLLGTDAQLVQAMIDRRPPRSLAAKAPWAVFGVAPLLALIVTALLLGNWSIAFFSPYHELSAAAIPQDVRSIGMTLSFIGSYLIGPVLLAACIAIAVRQRLSSRWVWTGLVLIALICGPFGFHIEFLTSGGPAGGIRGSVTQVVSHSGQVDAGATLIMMGARTAVLFVLSALAYALLDRTRQEDCA